MALFKKTPSNVMTVSEFDGVDCTKNITSTISSAEYMRNFRITQAKKLTKRHGFKLLTKIERAQNLFVNGNYLFYRITRKLYCIRLSDLSELATYDIPNTNNVGYFKFGNDVYIVSKSNIFVFRNSSFSPAEPYIPTIAITAPESGGGVVHESLNLLCDKAKISYSPSGSSNEFILPDIAQEVVQVTENGQVIDSSAYSFSVSEHKLTFTNTPSGGISDSLVVTFSFSSSLVDTLLLSNKKFYIYGGEFDTRLFVYGNGNVIHYSDITSNGADPLYFPSENFITVGDGTYNVTSLVRHYSSLAVFTSGDAWYITPSSVDYDGYRKASFPIYPLNGKIGCINNGGVLVDNYPLTVNKRGVYIWRSTTVRDERNAVCISDKIAPLLDASFLERARIFDYEAQKEVWLYYSGIVWIYNYRIDAWYCFDGIDANDMFEYNGQILFIKNSAVYLFDENLYTDNGKAYNAVWKSGFANFGKIDRKRLYRIYASLLPEGNSNVTVTLLSNDGQRVTVGQDGEFSNSVFDFSVMDFTAFSFVGSETGSSVVRRRIRLRRFDSVRLIIENAQPDSRATVERVVLR